MQSRVQSSVLKRQLVLDFGKNVVMTGTQLSENCYHWDNNLKFNLAKYDETILWHKHLEHKICKTINADVVHGVSLKQNTKIQCLECPVRK